MNSRYYPLIVAALLALPPVFAPLQAQQPRQTQTQQQGLILNDKGYFERQGVNFLVFSNAFTGGFND